MAAISGIDFSPYFDDASTSRESAPELCVVSFFDTPDMEGRLIAFLPEQNSMSVQRRGANTNELVPLANVRCVRFVKPVMLQSSIEHFRKRGIQVHTSPQRMPFSITFRNGQVFSGELAGYGASATGLGIYVAQDNQEVLRYFFPKTGVESFVLGDPIGKVLLERGQISSEGLGQALHAQQALRAQKLGDILAEQRVIDPQALNESLREQAKHPLRRIGEVMMEIGIIDAAQLEAALEEQKKRRDKPLGEILIGMGVLDKDSVRQALARKLGIPHVDLNEFKIDPQAFSSVPGDLLKRHKVVPLYHFENALVVAMSNPMDSQVLHTLSFATQRKIIPVLATMGEIEAVLAGDPANRIAIWEHENVGEGVSQIAGFQPNPQATAQAAEELAQRLDTETSLGAMEIETSDDNVKETDSTLVKLVNKIIVDAHQATASDIHIDAQPGEENVRVRFRIDGVLQDYLQVPVRFRKALISRIKIMSNLDISERRKPQDGKINFKRFGPLPIELRVATIPTHGDRENAVLRILSNSKPLPLEQMNFAPDVLEQMRALAQKPYGLLLVCGPTGSGKTTTLHSIIGHVNTPDRKIWTAEDPVEITQPGLAQVQVNAKLGWTFAAALRAFLRADPDVIMVGEMRDAETVHMGIEASLTGHLVLSTLHTNSAPEAVTRLLDMGLDPFNFADALLGVLAQRLVRRLCTACCRKEAPSSEALDSLVHEYCLNSTLEAAQVRQRWQAKFGSGGALTLMRPVGCEICQQTGYRGRLALHELLVGTHEIRHLVRTRAPLSELVACATGGGMRSLKQDGIEKVLQGHTTMEQVRAACV